MFAHIILSLGMILLVGCSQSAKRKVIVPEGEPEWLYSPQSGCEEDKYICASGEGSRFSESDMNAKKALASIFETSIHSKFKFTKHSFSDDEITEMSEMVQSKVDEDVAGVLKASTIKERFKKNQIRFSLAALDKSKSSQVLKQELSHIDSQLKHYYSLQNRLYSKKLNVLFNQRELLSEKLTILTEKPSKSPVSFSQIAMLKFKSRGGESIQIEYKSNPPSLLGKKIEEILTDVGYKLNQKNSEYVLLLNYKIKEEYLNVKGFKKFLFELDIESKSSDRKRLGGISITKVANGRNQKDAFAKIRNDLIEEFENNLEKLNLN
tara:strand:- start:31524 stop:32489 length:966 start_codon:yes stop_codon:yes gene_type:complete